MMQWLTNRFHTNCLSTIKQLNENLDQSEDVIKRLKRSESIQNDVLIKKTEELEECKKERDNIILQTEELKELISSSSKNIVSRAEFVLDLSNKLEEAKKYAEDSKKIIENLNAQIIEAKATLDYTLFEKDKEIAELKKKIDLRVKDINTLCAKNCDLTIERDTLKKELNAVKDIKKNMSPKRKKGSQ